MIRSREEYLFVTIPNEIKINGEIMPLREKKYELRGEDPAFLMEAAAERYVIWHGGSTTKSTMTREIRGDRLQAIARSIRADVTEGRYIKPWPAGPVYDVELDLATSLNLLYTEADLVSSPDDFTRGHPLVQKDVEKLFTDTDLLRNCNLYKTWHNWNWNNFSITHTYTHDEVGDAPEDSWETYGTTLYDYRCSCNEMSDWDSTYWYGQWKEAVASGGTATLDFSNWNLKYIKPVTRVWAICEVRHEWIDWTSGEDKTGGTPIAIAAFQVPASMDGSNISLSIGALADGAKTLLEHYGFEKLFLKIHGNQSASVMLSTVLPIVEMNNRCRWETETGETT